MHTFAHHLFQAFWRKKITTKETCSSNLQLFKPSTLTFLFCKQTLKNSVTRSRNFGRQANAWARTSTPAGQHTCVRHRPPAKSSGWPRGLHLQPHHARVIKLQKVSRLISGLVWLHTFSFTGGTLLQLPHVHTVMFLFENAQMKSYVCIYWTVQNVMELATLWRLNLAPRASNSVHCWDLPRNINNHYRMHTKVKPRYVCVRMRCASTWLSYPSVTSVFKSVNTETLKNNPVQALWTFHARKELTQT